MKSWLQSEWWGWGVSLLGFRILLLVEFWGVPVLFLLCKCRVLSSVPNPALQGGWDRDILANPA